MRKYTGLLDKHRIEIVGRTVSLSIAKCLEWSIVHGPSIGLQGLMCPAQTLPLLSDTEKCICKPWIVLTKSQNYVMKGSCILRKYTKSFNGTNCKPPSMIETDSGCIPPFCNCLWIMPGHIIYFQSHMSHMSFRNFPKLQSNSQYIILQPPKIEMSPEKGPL